MSVIWMDVDTALSEVPVNAMPLIDDTDFKSREEAVAYNAAGMDLIWHFVTTGGAYTATAVTPTTAGNYDWAHQDGAMYTIEIPASGGASINNDTEGFGYFTGYCTGVLPWRGPTIGLRNAALNNSLIDSTAGGLASGITAIESELILVHSETTALQGQATTIASDIVQVYSDTTTIATEVGQVHSETTALQAQATTIASDVVQIYSDTTHIDSDVTAAAVQITTIASDLVLVYSDTTAIETATSTAASDLAAIESELIVVHSDTTAIEAAGGALSSAQDSKLTEIHGDVNTVASDVVQVYSDTTVLTAGVNLTTWLGVTPAALTSTLVQAHVQSFQPASITASAIANDAIGAAELAADAAAEIAAAVWDRATASHVSAGTFGLLAADIYSDTTAIEAGGGALTAAQASQLLQVQSDLIIVGSDVVLIYSDTTAIEAGGGALTAAQASQLLQVQSDLIIVGSDVVLIYSDTTAIEAAGGALSVAQDSKLTEIHTDVNTVASDVVLVYSDTTTLLSRLTATRAGYLDNLSAGAVATASALSTVAGNITTILGKWTGITLLAEWLGLLAGKQTGDATALAEVRASGAGSGTFDPTTDALEALRDNQGTAQTGDAYARLGSPAGASIAADIAANLSAIGALNNLDSAAVQAATDAALVALHLDHLLAATYDPASKPGASDALLNELVESDSGVSRFTANALEQAPSGGGAATTKNGFVGMFIKDGSTYRLSAWLIVDGAVIAGGSLSSLSAAVYHGGAALTYGGSPAADASGEVRASGTISESVSNNQPISVKVQADYGGDTYSGVFPCANLVVA